MESKCYGHGSSEPVWRVRSSDTLVAIGYSSQHIPSVNPGNVLSIFKVVVDGNYYTETLLKPNTKHLICYTENTTVGRYFRESGIAQEKVSVVNLCNELRLLLSYAYGTEHLFLSLGHA